LLVNDLSNNVYSRSFIDSSFNYLKTYTDNVASGLDVKESVKLATTINLNALYNNGNNGVGATLISLNNEFLTVDDISNNNINDRILVKNQTNKTENGIYIIKELGSSTSPYKLERAVPDDEGRELTGGSFVFVEEGNINSNNGFVFTNNGTPSIGSTDIEVVQFSGAGQLIMGRGLEKNGNLVFIKDEIFNRLSNLDSSFNSLETSTNTRFTNLETKVDTSFNNVYTKTESDTLFLESITVNQNSSNNNNINSRNDTKIFSFDYDSGLRVTDISSNTAEISIIQRNLLDLGDIDISKNQLNNGDKIIYDSQKEKFVIGVKDTVNNSNQTFTEILTQQPQRFTFDNSSNSTGEIRLNWNYDNILLKDASLNNMKLSHIQSNNVKDGMIPFIDKLHVDISGTIHGDPSNLDNNRWINYNKGDYDNNGDRTIETSESYDTTQFKQLVIQKTRNPSTNVGISGTCAARNCKLLKYKARCCLFSSLS